VLEYVNADSVDLVIREYGPAPGVDALRVAAQLAGALDFAAAVQIWHGALHPRDVLLSSDETRLTGVGIAQALERIGVLAPVRRPYTPPEQIAGAAWDRRADVFSLAAVTHELLWARRVSGLGVRAVENLTEIPGADLEALRAAFARALAEDPASRFDTALEFAEALRWAFAGAIAGSHESSVVSPPASVVSHQSSVSSPQASLGSHQSSVGSPQAPGVGQQSPTVRQQASVVNPQSKVVSPQSNARPTRDDRRLPLDDGAHTEVDLPISAIDPAEEERYWELAAAPAIDAPDAPDARASTPGSWPYLDYVRDEPPRLDLGIPEPPAAAPVVVRKPHASAAPAPPETRIPVERSRSSMVPLVLALAVGLTMGFAAGYGVGTRVRPAPASAALPATPPPPAGQEFTESAVASHPAAPAVAPPSADVPSPTSDAVGRLLVRSTPAGALVFVDGQEYGLTPVAVRDLSIGGHRVRVVRDGYVAEEVRVVITPSRPSQSLTIDLERPASAAARGARPTRPAARRAPPAPTATPAPAPSERFTGTLTIISRPPGAAVFLDSRLVGMTPLSLPSVSAGSHAIRLEYDGYRRWTSSIRVVASEENRVTASLER
jgi:hypothetical protein